MSDIFMQYTINYEKLPIFIETKNISYVVVTYEDGSEHPAYIENDELFKISDEKEIFSFKIKNIAITYDVRTDQNPVLYKEYDELKPVDANDFDEGLYLVSVFNVIKYTTITCMMEIITSQDKKYCVIDGSFLFDVKND